MLLCTLIYFSNKNEVVNNVSDPYQVESTWTESNVREDEFMKLVDTYLIEEGIEDNVGIYIHNFESDFVYTKNSDVYFTAASTYKLPLVMLYYEFINSGEYSMDTMFQYKESHFEPGGVICDMYVVGDIISLKELLECVILYSDNTGAHILFDNLEYTDEDGYTAGWIAYKEAITKYSDQSYEPIFFSYDNIMSANYANDTLTYLYTNSDEFETLVSHLEQAMPIQYLNANIPEVEIQKYGSYLSATNSIGLVMEGSPYAISIFTSLGVDGERHIGNINEIAYTYFNGK